MNAFLDRQLIIKRIATATIILLAIILTSCSKTEPAKSPTPPPTPTDIFEQSSQANDNQAQETIPVPTETPKPAATITDDPEEISTPLPEQEGGSEGNGERLREDTDTSEQPKIETFNLSNANQIAPDGILQEISFFTGGGGGAGCIDTYELPEVIGQDPPEGETFLHQRVEIFLCGWQIDERVEISIKYPDGNDLIQEEIHGPYSMMHFFFKTNILNDPPGQYEITFSGESGTTKHQLNIQKPTGPQFYWNDDGTLILYNFEPEETVSVFAYTKTDRIPPDPLSSVYELHAWQVFNVDQNGTLIIAPQFTTAISWYAVIGEISEQIVPKYPASPITWGIYTPSILPTEDEETEPNEIWPVSETGVEACHLSTGDLVSAGENARLWSQPDVLTGSRTDAPFPEQQLEILGPPQWGRIRQDINAFGWWWEVSIESGDTHGWLWQERITECVN